jgi:pimeloyl-ACP methyl ester carboxylesterase
LKISSVVLVGWSQGAQDVSAYVQQFAETAVAGIVLVDSPVSAGAEELDIHKEFGKAIISSVSVYANHPAEFSQGTVQSLFKKPHPDLKMAKLASDSPQTPTNTGVAMLVADIFEADRRPALEKFSKPALDNRFGRIAAAGGAERNAEDDGPFEACGCAGRQSRPSWTRRKPSMQRSKPFLIRCGGESSASANPWCSDFEPCSNVEKFNAD